ncbi:DEAD-box ATP-dependent RNA helicase 52A [Candidatus Velamenicoccus archaeovorus]|uniref:DEAD-box ATP-dependent RNA helicase 52A n=1 Tax=Velamenicoccus archaeovorus TaxID=1930593 RepID=A0A410P3C1_VELA1|nr:hypothetical protein [Candidatus Velamenicoccus archaeovorus]QAT16695.1 DEAD-box ATP-dependent RNA helicase 52A [Candidatus Velamenicoccus archaeovorus]
MLRVLVVGFFIFSLVVPLGFCQQSDCSECSKDAVLLNPALKEKIEAIERQAYNRLEGSGKNQGSSITLFIDSDHGFSGGAIEVLARFKQDNPSWRVKTVIEPGSRNLKQTLLRNRNYFNSGMEFDIDLNGNLARKFGIDRTPTYVVFHEGRHYKTTDLSDLNEAIAKLNK